MSALQSLLERLVAQFASPYDFLRELVQNAMDGGSDLVDVALHVHAGAEGDDVVFELEVIDAGDGMDEAIIDGELTRLFGSSKAGDRTMAGGFGIGFVSVFAWDPDVVLLQTGRRDEAWELVFGRDRSFEKHRVQERLEGTTLRLFRRGHAAQREAIAEAVRDSLWRWCRFCPIDITFDDVEGQRGPELIRDAPLPDDAVVRLEHVDGETTIRAAFAPEPHVVLLRHGLVLAEGAPTEHLPHLASALGRTAEHLRLWVDSPRLRTSLARDRVVDDAGREALERDVAGILDTLRAALVQRVEDESAAPSWDPVRHDTYAFLHAHLACEHEHLLPRLASRPVLRSVGKAAVSAAGLSSRSQRFRVVGLVAPDAAPGPAEVALRVAAMRGGVPVVVCRWPRERAYVEPLLAQVGLRPAPLRALVSRVEPIPDRPWDRGALAELVLAVLQGADLGVDKVRVGRLVDARPRAAWALQLHSDAVLHGVLLPRAQLRDATIWIDPGHPLVAEAEALYAASPSVAALAVAQVVAVGIENPASNVHAVAEAWEELR